MVVTSDIHISVVTVPRLQARGGQRSKRATNALALQLARHPRRGMLPAQHSWSRPLEDGGGSREHDDGVTTSRHGYHSL